jgi:GH24 family phage-related lysozyme (muramidase)
VEGTGYDAIPRTIVIPPNKDSVKLIVKPKWDAADHGDRTIDLTLSTAGAKKVGNIFYANGIAIDPTMAEAKVTDPYIPARNALIAANEGSRAHVYLDTKNHLTVGIGHDMGPVGTDIGVANFNAVTGANFARVKAGRQDLTQAQITALFNSDARTYQGIAEASVSNFADQPLPIKLVLVDLCFNMGSLAKFSDFRQAIQARDYTQAIYDLGHKSRTDPTPSSYSTQVPNRYAANVARIQGVIDEIAAN